VIAAWWLLFRSSSLRWTVPLGSCLCMLLVSTNLRGRPETSMQASSEAALTILIWAPAMLLMVFSSMRSSGLSRADDILVLPLQLRSRVRRSLSVVGAQLTWVILGWIGFWAGCNYLAGSGATSLYSSMALNGIALAIITSLAGAVLAVHRLPAWSAAIAAALSYVGLAIWVYVPDVTGSVLFSPYAPLFFVEALPNRHLPELQLAWALVLAAVFTAWGACLLGARTSLVAIGVTALVMAAVSSSMPQILDRSGTLRLTCEPHGGVQICLWVDHGAFRPRIEAEVDLARALLGSTGPVDYLSERDLGEGLPPALPPAAKSANTVLIPTTADPAPREAAALIVVAALQPQAGCADLTTPATFGESVRAAVERMVIDQQETPSSARLGERELAVRIAAIRRDIAQCRSPVLQ
jgi:hypothetical protein